MINSIRSKGDLKRLSIWSAFWECSRVDQDGDHAIPTLTKIK
jgi:hypothetical protein